MLSTSGASLVAQVNADDAGRFRFDRVAAGGYVLYLASSRHVRMQYGASRPDGRGRLDRGRGGRARRRHRRADDAGRDHRAARFQRRPASRWRTPRVEFWEWGYSPTTGERALVRSSAGSVSHRRSRTLPARISCRPASTSSRRQDCRFARRSDPGRPGADSGADARGDRGRPSRRAAATPARRRTLGRRRTFPASRAPTDAEIVTVAAGQERSRVDFTMRMVPTASIRGVVVAPAASEPRGRSCSFTRAGGRSGAVRCRYLPGRGPQRRDIPGVRRATGRLHRDRVDVPPGRRGAWRRTSGATGASGCSARRRCASTVAT